MNGQWRWLSLTRRYWVHYGGSRATRGARQGILMSMEDPEIALRKADDGKAMALTEAIRGAVRLSEALDQELHVLVAEARNEGIAWSTIARQLGCSRQAAQQRFGAGLGQDVQTRLEAETRKAYDWAQLEIKHCSDEDFNDVIEFMEEQDELNSAMIAARKPAPTAGFR
jgi:hypothetical protein